MNTYDNFLNQLKIYKEAYEIESHPIPDLIGIGTYKIIHICPYAKLLFINGTLNNVLKYTIFKNDLLCIKFFKEIQCNHKCPHVMEYIKPNSIYSYNGFNGVYKTTFKPNTMINGLYIFLTPEYYNINLANRFPNINFPIDASIANLNKDYNNPYLLNIFYNLCTYQSADASSLLFYESKLNEFLAYVLHQFYKNEEPRKSNIKKSDIEAVKKIAYYISTNIDSFHNIDTLARMACMSTAKLKYIFKDVFSMSIRDYKLMLRMNKAKELLKTTDTNICDIAHAVGYKSSSSFSDTFKQQFGISPKQYRNKNCI